MECDVSTITGRSAVTLIRADTTQFDPGQVYFPPHKNEIIRQPNGMHVRSANLHSPPATVCPSGLRGWTQVPLMQDAPFVARQAYPAVSFQFERMIPEGNPKEKGNRDCYRALRAQIRIPVLELLDAQLLCGRDNPGSTPGEDIARAAHVGPPVGTGDAPRSAFPLAEQSRPDCFRAECYRAHGRTVWQKNSLSDDESRIRYSLAG
jgi:hypothetical protein